MLFVLGAEAAVVGAALVGAGAERPRQAGRLAVLVAVVVGDVRADEVLDDAVLGAALAEVAAAGADDDLGIDEAAALRAEAAGGAQKGVIAQLHPCCPPLSLVCEPRSRGLAAER